MRYRLVCLDAGFTPLKPVRSLSDALRGVLARHAHEVGDDELQRAWAAADRWFWEDSNRPMNDTWSSDATIDLRGASATWWCSASSGWRTCTIATNPCRPKRS
jgi:hypothetical protein